MPSAVAMRSATSAAKMSGVKPRLAASASTSSVSTIIRLTMSVSRVTASDFMSGLFGVLEVAVVPAVEPLADHHHFQKRRDDPCGLGAGQLQLAGVLLLGHYRGAGAVLRGQLEVAELGDGEEYRVVGEFGEVEHDLGAREDDGLLELAAGVVGVEDVVDRLREAEELGRVLAVDGDRDAVAGGGAQGVLVVEVVGDFEEHVVVEQRLGEGRGPEAER